ncbi:MAG: DUF2235 domain-containing protein [Acidobacteriales bacterium]|nr:DUF2235 domain-containing protein [Candidatus Koribacter versatilis]MBI3646255.1 DUF2235 domain-containing protein [Terriglobales bacterium]
MPKNVVICCDGTNSSFQRDLTNVARMSCIASRVPGAQHVYYDVGVGVEEPGFVTKLGATLYRWAGLAFGAGLVKNVVQAYREIVSNYEPGDRLFLFGFSRGAYTVRVLAGVLENYGLLKRENQSEVEDVIRKFSALFPKKGSADAEDPARREAYCNRTFAEARQIRESRSVECLVHFMGIWDTVSSLGWAYDPKTFPNTAAMRHVRVIRHALALDERRAKFRSNRIEPVPGAQQDIQEVWFGGDHSDVGGGYPDDQSGLAKKCLEWMLREACQHDLRKDPAKEKELLEGPKSRPDAMGPQHESLEKFWWVLEYIRLPYRRQVDSVWKEEMIRYCGKGWRRIRDGDLVHRSVQERAKQHLVKNSHWSAAEAKVQWVD